MKHSSAKAQNPSSVEDIDPYRRCRRSVVIRVNGEECEIYCEDKGDHNYKPPCYRFDPCTCGAMDVVVTWPKDADMHCATCGAPRGCPVCASGPGNWRLYTSELECGSCGASYKRQAPPSKTVSTTLQGRLAEQNVRNSPGAAEQNLPVKEAPIDSFRPAEGNNDKNTEWDRLNDLAMVRGFEVLKNTNPDNVGGKYTIWSLDSRNPDKVDDIEHQAASAADVLEFLNHYPVYHKQGYEQRPPVRAAQKRLDDAVLTLTLNVLKEEDKKAPHAEP